MLISDLPIGHQGARDRNPGIAEPGNGFIKAQPLDAPDTNHWGLISPHCEDCDDAG